MPILYDIGTGLFYTGVRLAAPFNKKAKKWVQGRKNVFDKLKLSLKGVEAPIWVHCSSLGEFEQGKPIIDALKKRYPEKKIVLTFFSPSGLEVVQEKEPLVFYLPADSSKNAQNFLDIIKPCAAIFVKYEFWFYYLRTLHERNIPTFVVSAIFRKEQTFFKWYGHTDRSLLQFFNTIFVQDETSVDLLKSIGIENVLVSGDTRFDRVAEIALINERSEILEIFVEGASNALVAGSTWPKDEKLIANFFNSDKSGTKLIIAPHEVHKTHITELVGRFEEKVVLWSDPRLRSDHGTNNIELKEAKILIIDTIGILNRAYKYGSIAYIGGGFENGIHNILEAAAYGLPVLFGPNYEQFKEARDLIENGGAVSIKDQKTYDEALNELLQNEDIKSSKSEICAQYVQAEQGATQIFMDVLKTEMADSNTL